MRTFYFSAATLSYHIQHIDECRNMRHRKGKMLGKFFLRSQHRLPQLVQKNEERLPYGTFTVELVAAASMVVAPYATGPFSAYHVRPCVRPFHKQSNTDIVEHKVFLSSVPG
jgi:hypothetical protein